MSNRYWKDLHASQQAVHRLTCAGLDLTLEKLPSALRGLGWRGQIKYAMELTDAVADFVGYIKINVAFYGSVVSIDLIEALHKIVNYIHTNYPDVAVILDAKLGDIDSTNEDYATMVFDHIGADAVTVHQYTGRVKGMQPFLDRGDRGVIVLCRTSNAGGAEMQDIEVHPLRDQNTGIFYASERHYELEHGETPVKGRLVHESVMPMFLYVAHRVATAWNSNRNCALVVGATFPAEAAEVRQIAGGLPFLVPGIGRQGGKLEEILPASVLPNGTGAILNNSSKFSFAYLDSDVPDAEKKAPELARDLLYQQHLDTLAVLKNLPN